VLSYREATVRDLVVQSVDTKTNERFLIFIRNDNLFSVISNGCERSSSEVSKCKKEGFLPVPVLGCGEVSDIIKSGWKMDFSFHSLGVLSLDSIYVRNGKRET